MTPTPSNEALAAIKQCLRHLRTTSYHPGKEELFRLLEPFEDALATSGQAASAVAEGSCPNGCGELGAYFDQARCNACGYTAQPASAPAREGAAFTPELVEGRLNTWRQRQMNRSGDRLALDDFMAQESIDDLIDFVCAPATPASPALACKKCGVDRAKEPCALGNGCLSECAMVGEAQARTNTGSQHG